MVTDSNKKPAEKRVFAVVPEGLEPSMTGPESVVLPLHHGTKFRTAKIVFFFIK